MKKFLSIALGVIAFIVIAAYIVLYFIMPRQRLPVDLTVEITPERLDRGTYLVEHVLLCNDCHSERNWSIYGGPPMPPLGAGRPCMTRDTASIGVRVSAGQGNFPGVLCIRNITPDPESGIGNWTDGEIIRAMREGVDHAGERPVSDHAVFHLSPHVSDQRCGGRRRIHAHPGRRCAPIDRSGK